MEIEFRPIIIYTFDTKVITLYLDGIVPLVKSEFWFHRQIQDFPFNNN